MGNLLGRSTAVSLSIALSTHLDCRAAKRAATSDLVNGGKGRSASAACRSSTGIQEPTAARTSLSRAGGHLRHGSREPSSILTIFTASFRICSGSRMWRREALPECSLSRSMIVHMRGPSDTAGRSHCDGVGAPAGWGSR